MTTINDPTVVAEVTDLYLKYEEALANNNLEVMDSLFWDAPEVVRFGITENLYGGDEVRNFRQNRPNPKIEREISNLKVAAFGKDAATVTLEFHRIIYQWCRAFRTTKPDLVQVYRRMEGSFSPCFIITSVSFKTMTESEKDTEQLNLFIGIINFEF
ncbi:AtzH-like domain-containing protein [Nostoc sp.]|uniref:AtzH-like domain-containing protein n=1 Tax=Nostoc sp. TaxID=1180 RepID=UPI002FF75C79